MVTYNCEECGSWSNQHMGRTSVKGENTKFQFNFGPPTDINCSHCGARQMVFFKVASLVDCSLLDQCGLVPSMRRNLLKSYNRRSLRLIKLLILLVHEY